MTTKRGIVFTADFDYEGTSESELTFRKGDEIRIISTDGGWWLGQAADGVQGWLSPSFGHYEVADIKAANESTSQSSQSPSPGKSPGKTKNSESTSDGFDDANQAVLENIVNVEADYVKSLERFVLNVVQPLLLCDSPFKRTLMMQSSVKVTLSLLRDIHYYSSCFLINVQNLKDAHQSMAKCYFQLCQTLQLYSRYFVECPNCINALQTVMKQLKEMFPTYYVIGSTTIAEMLRLPMQHYQSYYDGLRTFVGLSLEAAGELEQALDVLKLETDSLKETETVTRELNQLMDIQNSFIDLPTLFLCTRRLVREGQLEKLSSKSHEFAEGDVEPKTFTVHLFNDCFVYSNKQFMGNRHRLVKVIDLTKVSLSKVDLPGFPHAFSFTEILDDAAVGIQSFAETEIWRCPGECDAASWFRDFELVIEALRPPRVRDRRRTVEARSSFAQLVALRQAGTFDKLGPRARKLFEFLLAEQKLADALTVLKICVVQPLLDASKGAILTPTDIIREPSTSFRDENETSDFFVEAPNRNLFSTRSQTVETSLAFAQAKQIRETLLSSDFQLFLCAADILANLVREFVDTLQGYCVTQNWSENMDIGVFFDAAHASNLYSQYKLYASRQHVSFRLLKEPLFAEFYPAAEQALSKFPGTFETILEAPRNRPQQYLDFLRSLTEPIAGEGGASAIQSLAQSIKLLESVVSEMGTVARDKKNFEKLMEIQRSIVRTGGGIFGNEASEFVSKLASTDRKFLKEGDLKLVGNRGITNCRIWLFSDCIVYAHFVGSETFSFKHALDLRSCYASVYSAAGSNYKNAMQLLSSEKSFVALAPSPQSLEGWISAINGGRQALSVTPVAFTLSSARLRAGSSAGGTTTLPTSVVEDVSLSQHPRSPDVPPENLSIAPLWAPDKASSQCSVCKGYFGVFRRRHHCRECGHLVCHEHSKNRVLLEHIHKMEEQRVCDTCVVAFRERK